MKDKIWVGVEAFGGIVTDVHLFPTEEEAETWFEEYTGIDYADGLYDEDGNCKNEDYDQTKIFVLDRP